MVSRALPISTLESGGLQLLLVTKIFYDTNNTIPLIAEFKTIVKFSIVLFQLTFPHDVDIFPNKRLAQFNLYLCMI